MRDWVWQRGRRRTLAVGLLAALAVATGLGYGFLRAERNRSRLLAPEALFGEVPDTGRVFRPEFQGNVALVPMPLYPGSRIQQLATVPTGFGKEVGMYLMLATADDPLVVRDYYLSKWHQYGARVVKRNSVTRDWPEWDIVTRKTAGRAASVTVLRAASGVPASLSEPLQPPASGSEETKIIFFVPYRPMSAVRD